MADFCNGCEDTVLGVDEDKRTKYSKDETSILCEGCGVWMIVDKNGHILWEEENDDTIPPIQGGSVTRNTKYAFL